MTYPPQYIERFLKDLRMNRLDDEQVNRRLRFGSPAERLLGQGACAPIVYPATLRLCEQAARRTR